VEGADGSSGDLGMVVWYNTNMAEAIFDTHRYVKKLKEAGVPEGQAEIQAEALKELLESKLVNREYLDLRLSEIRADIRILKWMLGVVISMVVGIILILIKSL